MISTTYYYFFFYTRIATDIPSYTHAQAHTPPRVNTNLLRKKKKKIHIETGGVSPEGLGHTPAA